VDVSARDSIGMAGRSETSSFSILGGREGVSEAGCNELEVEGGVETSAVCGERVCKGTACTTLGIGASSATDS
jgi:ketopantoate hydroxymethyltransferase